MFKVNPTARALLVFSSVVTLATGVTLAVFNSQVTLAGSRMSSTTAELKIRTAGTRKWSDEVEGFRIKNLVPGTGETRSIYFRNTGGVPLTLSMRVPHRPDRPHGGYGFSGWENLTVDISGSCDSTVHTTMAMLLGNMPVALPCSTLPVGAAGDPGVPNHVGNYALHFDIKPSAITGSRAGVGDFDIQFTGEQN
jgi:hypothetical protein